MSSHVFPREVTISEPLIVEIVVRHATTREPLFVMGERLMTPGEIIQWGYPPEGLKITLGG